MPSIKILDNIYEYRPVTRAELKTLEKLEQWELENRLCELCSKPPEGYTWDNVPAGVPITLSKLILEISGVSKSGFKKLEDNAKDWILNGNGKISSLISFTLHIPLTEVENLEPEMWHKAVLAAQIIGSAAFNIDMKEYLSFDPFDNKKNLTKIPEIV